MKTFITILVVVFAGMLSCDTPEPASGNPGDTTSINSSRPDTTLQNKPDTSMRRDSIPQP